MGSGDGEWGWGGGDRGGSLQNLMGGLSQYMGGGAWDGLKCCQKIPVKEFI